MWVACAHEMSAPADDVTISRLLMKMLAIVASGGKAIKFYVFGRVINHRKLHNTTQRSTLFGSAAHGVGIFLTCSG